MAIPQDLNWLHATLTSRFSLLNLSLNLNLNASAAGAAQGRGAAEMGMNANQQPYSLHLRRATCGQSGLCKR
jgi:hypothetical protein